MGKKVIIFTWIIAFIIIPAGLYLMFSPYTAPPTPTYTSWRYDYPSAAYPSIVSISDNGQFIVAGDSGEDNVYLFNKSSSTPLWTYTGAIFDITSVDISSTGDFLVAGSGNQVYFFNRTSSTPLWNFQVPLPEGADSVAMSSDGKYIAVGSNQTLYLLNNSVTAPKLPIWTNSTTFTYHPGTDPMYVSISNNGTYILTANRINSIVRLFNNTSPKPMMTIDFSGDIIYSIAMSSDGNYFVVQFNDKIQLFNKTSTTPEWEFTAFAATTRCIAISDDGNYIAAGFQNGGGNIYFFNRTSNIPIWSDGISNLESLALSTNGSILIAGTESDAYYYNDTSVNTPIQLNGDDIVDISADGKYFVATGGELYFYDGENTELYSDPGYQGPTQNPLWPLYMSMVTGPLFIASLITIISVARSRKKKRRPIRIRAPKIVEPIPIDRELIFISYATVDSELFQIPRITKILTSYPEIDEILYWESDMHDDIYQYMDDNLKLAKVVLLFCSKNSLYSEAVKMEWRSALKLEKKIIPIFIDPSDIPPLLTTKLGIQFDEKDPYTSIENLYKMILTKLEVESFRDFTKYLIPKKINKKEFGLMNPESIEKSVIFDSDLASHELSDKLTYILQDNNFFVPGKQLKVGKKKKKKKVSTQEVGADEFIKFSGFSELKDDKEDVGIFITIQKVTDRASKVFLKGKGQREWVLNEVLNNINLKCMDLKDTNEVIRTYSEKVGSLMDKITDVDKFLHKYLGPEYKKVGKLIAQYKNNEIGKEELIIKGSQLAGKEFITVFIKNIPMIIQESKKSGKT